MQDARDVKLPLMLSVEELREVMNENISAQTIRKCCSDGTLPAVKVGRKWFVPRDRFLEFANGGDGKNE